MRKIFLLVPVLFLSFMQKEATQPEACIPNVAIRATDPGLFQYKGLILYNGRPFSGYVEEYYDNSRLKSRTGYYRGSREGRALQYYPDGKLREERWYHQGLKTGLHKGWWPRGNKKFEKEFRGGLSHGSHLEWYSSGKPAACFHFVSGKEDGTQQMWFDDGSVKCNYTVLDGWRYGFIGEKNCKKVKEDILLGE